MKATFYKGIVLGRVVSLATLMGATAFAGTGVGGLFNLGQNNTVNGTTKLTGATAAGQLDVVNNSTGTGANGDRDFRQEWKGAAGRQFVDKGEQSQRRPARRERLHRVPERVAGQCANRTAISAVKRTAPSAVMAPPCIRFTTTCLSGDYGQRHVRIVGLEIQTQCLGAGEVGALFREPGRESGHGERYVTAREETQAPSRWTASTFLSGRAPASTPQAANSPASSSGRPRPVKSPLSPGMS